MNRDEVREALIKWDLDQGRAMISAELSLRTPTKPYQWSPQLRNAGILLRYWKLRLKEVQQNHYYSETFARLQAKTQVTDPTFILPSLNEVLSIEQIWTALNTANKNLRRTQRNSTDHRLQSYHDLIITYNEDQNPATQSSKQKSKIVANTIRNEQCRSVYRKIGAVIKPSDHSAGLSKLNIPRHKDCPNITQPTKVHNTLKNTAPTDIMWDTVITKQDIEARLLTYNREAFRAASKSPCGHGIIHDAITFSSLSPEADRILQGSIPPDWHSNDPLILEFLASFSIPQQHNTAPRDAISTTITPDDITKGFKAGKK
ncbi:hypothetical protein MHU86_17079 [Fragilaria crotonensis]|nr:hypothetical protein MHU86_17079 [Fragilaria crotonensis]